MKSVWFQSADGFRWQGEVASWLPPDWRYPVPSRIPGPVDAGDLSNAITPKVNQVFIKVLVGGRFEYHEVSP